MACFIFATASWRRYQATLCDSLFIAVLWRSKSGSDPLFSWARISIAAADFLSATILSSTSAVVSIIAAHCALAATFPSLPRSASLPLITTARSESFVGRNRAVESMTMRSSVRALSFCLSCKIGRGAIVAAGSRSRKASSHSRSLPAIPPRSSGVVRRI